MELDSRLLLPIPAYGGRSLANIAPTLYRLLGPGAGDDAPPLPGLASDLDPFEGRRPEGPVVLLLLDGLGWTAFEGSATRLPRGPAAAWRRHARPITSVFPTTTTVALTSLSSGAAPGQHGALGHRVFLPRFGTVVELLRMSPLGVGPAETLVGPDWSPKDVSGVPTVFRRGVPAVAVSRDRFEGTGFTRLIYDGAPYIPYATGSELALSLVEVLSREAPPPLVVVYRDDLDVVQHVRGTVPELIDLEVSRVRHLLAFVAEHLGPRVARRTTLLVTGDHGQVPLAADRQIVVDREPTVLEHLARPPSGDRRAAYFAARPGHLARLTEVLEQRVPSGGRVLEIPSLVDAGLFGPPPHHPEIAERLGDLLVLLPSPGGVTYTVPGARARPHRMISAHGGLERDELLVPLVSGSVADLAGEPTQRAHPRAPPSRSGAR